MQKVSVIVPCYNNGEFLYACLLSLVNQTYKNWEAIIVDDGSTQNIKSFIKDFETEKRIIYHKQTNTGVSGARNKGIALSTGEYIQFLDADDYIMPDKFETQVAEINNNNADIAYCGYFAFTHPFENIGETSDTKFDESKSVDEIVLRWEHGLCIPIHCFLYKKTVFKEVGIFDVNFKKHEDWHFHIRCAMGNYKYIHNPEKFARYRVHANSSCRTGGVLMSEYKAAVMNSLALSRKMPKHLKNFLQKEVLKISKKYTYRNIIEGEEVDEKCNFKNVTYIIPIRIDTQERLKNLDFCVKYLQNNFDTNILIIENDTESRIHKRYEGVRHILYIGKTNDFHRTKLLNYAVKVSKTDYFCNMDCDVFIEKDCHIKAIEMLANYSVVYPYSGSFYDIPQKYNTYNTLKFSDVPENEKGLINPNSTGGCIYFNKKDFIVGGMENENFISWGYEDNERYERFNTLGFKIKRLENPLYHFTHPRGVNSGFSNPHIPKSKIEYDKIHLMNKSQLTNYVNETFKWRNI
jgi:glycosyltransferase involved in cell wall biosynthesis